MNSGKRTLYLIDGSSYIYRAFYAVRHLSTAKGIPTNAVYGFVGMLNRILKEKRPEYLTIALDAPGPTFRHDLSPDYKANRPQMPEPLAVQIPFIKRLIGAYGVPCLEAPGFEADDIIGTLTTWASQQGSDVVIISGDKDLLQLVSPRVRIWDTMKDIVIGTAEVEERYGVHVSQLVDLMGLAGDSSDNIPGVPGIGPKTAQRLIKEFGNLDGLLSNLDKIPKEKEREKLKTYSGQAILSRKLVQIKCDVPVEKDWQNLRLGMEDRQRLLALFRELEFKRFIQELTQEQTIIDPHTVSRDYQLVITVEALEAAISQIQKSRQLALMVQTTGEDHLRADLVGLGLAWGTDEACYVPVRHFDAANSDQMASSEVLELLTPVLQDPAIAKFTHDSKLARIIFERQGVELAGMQLDTMLAAYILNPGNRVQDLEVIAREYLDEAPISLEALVGTDSKRRSFASVPPEQASIYAGDQAVCCLRLATVLDEKIKEAKQFSLLHDMEMPLVPVLTRMEMNGVRVDVKRLKRLAAEFGERLESSAQKIYTLAGGRFNINSPQQLGHILFNQLGLPMGKKTKTGYSTAMDVLSALTPHHPLPEEVLNYRSLMKLKSTYVDPLPRLVDPESGRLHTSYNQTVTVTGRLSSSEPNLQNIPVRSEEGREIRRAFVPDSGCQLISADYSQIELRILAHYTGDRALVEAFRRGEDIHRRTAAEIFGGDPGAITPEMRRQAKTINFGIIYGMTPYRLAKDLNIPQGLAREIIGRYFERYQGVRSYVARMPKVGREKGFVTTLFQRKRYLPDLHSRNRNLRQFAERTAVNTPIQGSAADIIKLAMIRIDAKLLQKKLPARMIMQVHDELVLEVETTAAEEVGVLVQSAMESVASLDVPLLVDIGYGANWDEAH
ncbi:MAG: DNA polymerase I [Deltaproteobacteria bacterium]|nr:MAG: DNA polymerase I [Deltaproteobacteria bacterium]